MTEKDVQVKENNKRLIIIAGAAFVVLVGIFVILGISLGWFSSNKKSADSSNKTTTTAEPNVVEETKGSENKTTKAKLSLRYDKYGAKPSAVEKYENKQKDTVNTPIINPPKKPAKGGYRLYQYTFTDDAKYMGAKPASYETGSMVSYSFKKNKLLDVRYNYGKISKEDVATIQKELEKKYGECTFYQKYSSGDQRFAWRGKDGKLLTFVGSPRGSTTLVMEFLPR